MGEQGREKKTEQKIRSKCYQVHVGIAYNATRFGFQRKLSELVESTCIGMKVTNRQTCFNSRCTL
jgi:hypothetical protein